VTGGGVPGKLASVLKPSGTGAHLDSLLDPCAAMLDLQEVGNVADREAYKTWNMGQGGLVITGDPGSVIEVAKEFDLDAKVVGEITKKPDITIVSKGAQDTGKELAF
jgi:phosphoribosylaminoimidazole (AIR) synthetase